MLVLKNGPKPEAIVGNEEELVEVPSGVASAMLVVLFVVVMVVFRGISVSTDSVWRFKRIPVTLIADVDVSVSECITPGAKTVPKAVGSVVFNDILLITPEVNAERLKLPTVTLGLVNGVLTSRGISVLFVGISVFKVNVVLDGIVVISAAVRVVFGNKLRTEVTVAVVVTIAVEVTTAVEVTMAVEVITVVEVIVAVEEELIVLASDGVDDVLGREALSGAELEEKVCCGLADVGIGELVSKESTGGCTTGVANVDANCLGSGGPVDTMFELGCGLFACGGLIGCVEVGKDCCEPGLAGAVCASMMIVLVMLAGVAGISMEDREETALWNEAQLSAYSNSPSIEL